MAGLELDGVEYGRRAVTVEQADPHPAGPEVDPHQVRTFGHGALPSEARVVAASCEVPYPGDGAGAPGAAGDAEPTGAGASCSGPGKFPVG